MHPSRPTARAALALSISALLGTASAFAADEEGLGHQDTPTIPGTDWRIHDGARPQPIVVTPGESFSQQADAPSDAIVLFDGTDFSRWIGNKGEPEWKIVEDYMEVTKSGSIRTRDEFGDFQLHLEFATPERVVGTGQGRGNNGVNIYGRYEIQILDSHNNKTYPDGQAGAIYGQYPPRRNASKGPGEWQTYDIIWESPRWNDDGELTKKGYVTVLHNGVVLHHRQELLGRTRHKGIGDYRPHPPRGHIQLFEHGNPVRFRNIWIRPLGEYDEKPEESAKLYEGEPLKALLVTGGCCHNYEFQSKAMTEGISAQADVEWTVVNEGGRGTRAEIGLYGDADWAKAYDVVVHNECFADTDDANYIRAITKAHKDGTPAVVVHCAMHTYRAADVDDWRQFLGVSSFHHEHQSEYPVEIAEEDHPVMRGFPDDWVTARDELYVIRKVWPGTTVLAYSPSERSGERQPVVWVNDFEGTRVFGTTYGHSDATFRDPVFINLLARGLVWAAGEME